MRKIKLKLNKNKKSGLQAISLVSKPAFQSNFYLLSSDEDNQQIFHFSDNEKQIVTGVLMIPNKLVYRNADSMEDGEDGYIYFSEDCIQDTLLTFLSSDNVNKITLEHCEGVESNKIQLYELWLIENPEMDKSKVLGFNDLPKGSLMCSLKINDLDLWNEVKSGKYKGFSIEALYDFDQVTELSENKQNKNEIILKILDIIKGEYQLTV